MGGLSTGEFWSIVSSIVSLILGFFAIALSVYFYVAGRGTEKQISNSLTKIEAQAEMLQKLSGRQLDRLTQFVTKERPDATQEITKLFLSFSELTKPLSSSIPEGPTGRDPQQLRRELVTCYIGIYYYAAIANVWSQVYLPDVSEFEENNDFHQLTRRVVEMSWSDFDFMAGILSKCDPEQVDSSPLNHLLAEVRDHWRDAVRNVADVYIARSKSQGRDSSG